MGKSILKAFMDGNLKPNERSFRRGTEYDKAAKVLSVCEEKFLAVLNKDEMALFDEFNAAVMNFSALESDEKFLLGYRLGALMTYELMDAKDDLVF